LCGQRYRSVPSKAIARQVVGASAIDADWPQ
jgi:hypothetical protein